MKRTSARSLRSALAVFLALMLGGFNGALAAIQSSLGPEAHLRALDTAAAPRFEPLSPGVGLPSAAPLGEAASAETPPLAAISENETAAPTAVPERTTAAASHATAFESASRPLPAFDKMDDASAKDAAGAPFVGSTEKTGSGDTMVTGVLARAMTSAAPLLPTSASHDVKNAAALVLPKPESADEPAPPRSLFAWIESHKGGVSLSFAAALYLSGLAVIGATSWHASGEVLRSLGGFSLVGGLCDLTAITAIFQKIWWLPGSGVLPRNREKIVDGIAKTIETKWLTPEMIRAKLEQINPADQAGRFAETVSIEKLVGREQLKKLCAYAAAQLDSPPLRRSLEEMIRKHAPNSLRFANSLGLVDYSGVSANIISRLRQEIAALPADAQRIEMIEKAIHSLGADIRKEGSSTHEAVNRTFAVLADHALAAGRGQIGRIVKENLMKLSDEELRRQVESRTRTHLDWIRVNGVICGALFGVIFDGLNFAFDRLPSLIAALH